jgi:hypothetical protein
MAYFSTKYPDLGKFWSGLLREMLVYYMNILIFSGFLVYFVAIWYILCLFGTFFLVLVCCTNKNLATPVCKYCLRINLKCCLITMQIV